MKIALITATLAQALSITAPVCTPSAISAVRKAQSSPESFCNVLNAAAVSKACYCILSPQKTTTTTETITSMEFAGGCGNATAYSTTNAPPSTSRTPTSTSRTSATSTATQATAYPSNRKRYDMFYIQVVLPSPRNPSDPISSHAAINNTFLLGPSDASTASNGTFLGYYDPTFAPRRFTADAANYLLGPDAKGKYDIQFGHYFGIHLRYDGDAVDMKSPATGRVVVAPNAKPASDASEYRENTSLTTFGAEMTYYEDRQRTYILAYDSNGCYMSKNYTIPWRRSKANGLQGARLFLARGC
ncbi:hypothetical protein KVT40_001056 [Elsinoe batatas]|uniref:Uncharacterized protein n=1 Tax=Elsinoe batatas TaxID=2601811 RepID=A0A8K0L8H2_9PEZI|nr:hypothetical protein KVT40_001056 [Elsinoe batatas]